MSEVAPSGSRLLVAGPTGWLGAAVLAAARRRGTEPVALPRGGDLPADVGAGDVLVLATGAGDRSDPAQLREAHVEVPVRLARAALGRGARVLALGSAAEYGVPQHPLVAEDHREAPANAYGESKLAATRALLALPGAEGRVTVARVFNVLGPGRRDPDPVQDFARAVRALPPQGGTVEAWDSSLERDLAPVGWVGERLVDLAGLVGRAPVVNVCTGRATRFADLVTAMAAVRGVRAQVRDVRPGGIPRVVGDPALLTRLLGGLAVPTPDEVARVALDA